ncbi:YbaB/EbfC family nucleoid-associated protein [Saccharomonospora cyanea]|uniref:YbaB/EbfC DNA-binding family protein n=1 Tax=Saccharomonospora cyanea NA-134 TaxID=882082 RepID=H5XLC9_9PSEU|nr:YbaB/EbfC family nucleoid-associated protein [Saccharomonospora cyanea]EHR63969.1 hypothetical protein SaccyDRAFT_5175 [Saccharomonospora cyanea NA-134]
MTTAGNTAAITVTSADGLVSATIGPNGELSDLEFVPEVFDRTDPAELARTVLDLVHAAGIGRPRELDPPTGQLAPPGPSSPPPSPPSPPKPPRPTPKRARRAR